MRSLQPAKPAAAAANLALLTLARLARLVLVPLLWALLGLTQPALAQSLQPVPPLTARVTDLSGTLDNDSRAALESKLAAFEQIKGSQVAILLLPSTQPEDIASYANRVANAWKIGRREVGDGVLLVVAIKDRRVRIEVAKTLEGALPDLATKRIIDEAISPNFRSGNYLLGLDAALDRIFAHIRGEALPEPKAKARGAGVPGFQWFDLLIVLLIVVPVVSAVLRSFFGRRLGSLVSGGGAGTVAFWLTASVLGAVLVGLVALLFSFIAGSTRPSRYRRGRSSSSWGSSSGGFGGGFGSSSSSSSGGFSSGGGGDFGGGGASGDW